MEMFYTRF